MSVCSSRLYRTRHSGKARKMILIASRACANGRRFERSLYHRPCGHDAGNRGDNGSDQSPIRNAQNLGVLVVPLRGGKSGYFP